MKKLLTVSIAIILLTLPIGCSESSSINCEPTCGVITSMGFASGVANYYEIYVKNECSGRTKGFRVSQSEYYSLSKGDEVCTTDDSSWKRSTVKN